MTPNERCHGQSTKNQDQVQGNQRPVAKKNEKDAPGNSHQQHRQAAQHKHATLTAPLNMQQIRAIPKLVGIVEKS